MNVRTLCRTAVAGPPSGMTVYAEYRLTGGRHRPPSAHPAAGPVPVTAGSCPRQGR